MKTRITTIFVVVLTLSILTLFANTQATMLQSATSCVEVYENGELQFSSLGCVSEPTVTPTTEPTVEPTLTLTPTTEPTVEPTPTLTPTTEPTVEPTPTDEPGEPVAPFPNAPSCPTHDNKTYHSLWDAQRGCHYDHMHGDDWHSLDDVLGTDVYVLMDGDGMGTPWQTVNSEGYLENDRKHAGYIGYVRSDMPCQTAPCVDNVRVIVHQHTLADASVRFHSSTVQGTTSDGGYFLFGTHVDFGDLHAPEGTRVIDVEGNHCGSTTNPGNHRQHAVEGGNRAPSNIWYGRSRLNSDVTVDRECGFVQLGTSAQDPWIWTSQEGPTYQGNYVCYPNARCRNNATAFRMHLFTIFMTGDERFDFIYDENGVANFEGWADRYGVPYADGGGCTEPSIDCTPFVVQGLRRGVNYGTHPDYTERMYQDHDIYFNGQTANWSQPID